MDNYMTENKIPELMGNLMKNLAVSKPEDPIGFMIELLTKSDKRRYVLCRSRSKTHLTA